MKDDLRRPASLVRILSLVVGGILLIILVQVTNNALFDRLFPTTTIVRGPAGLDSR